MKIKRIKKIKKTTEQRRGIEDNKTLDLAKDKYKIQDGVTQSILSTWLTCPQKARYVLDGWIGDGALSGPLRFGSCFHNLLEVLYSEVGAGDLPHENIPRFFNSWSKAWTKLNISRSSGADDYEAIRLDISMANGLLDGYIKMWPKDFNGMTEWVALEDTFDIEWRGFRLRGKVDGIKRVNGKLWLLESKTRGRIDEKTLPDLLSFDFQSMFYITAMSQRMKEPVAGVVYNIIRRPGIKLRKNETMKTYAGRLAVETVIRPNHYYKRYEMSYSVSDLLRFEGDLIVKLSLFSKWLRGEHPNYRNETACVGRFPCDFIPACASCGMTGYVQERKLFRELV